MLLDIEWALIDSDPKDGDTWHNTRPKTPSGKNKQLGYQLKREVMNARSTILEYIELTPLTPTEGKRKK